MLGNRRNVDSLEEHSNAELKASDLDWLSDDSEGKGELSKEEESNVESDNDDNVTVIHRDPLSWGLSQNLVNEVSLNSLISNTGLTNVSFQCPTWSNSARAGMLL
jgi:hypothetical protein